MEHPKDRGEKTEAVVLAELVKRDITLLTPFGENNRYDFVVEVGGKFYRLQCKSGIYREGTVRFSTSSTQPHGTGYTTQDYKGEIDYFIVYAWEIESLYLIPVEVASKNEMRLRVDPPLNNQKSGINWASDFEFDNRIKRLGWNEFGQTQI
jgi:hypothetical protein